MRIGCTDSSDGLFPAVQDLSIASKCKAIMIYEKIPKDKDWPKGDEWDEYYFWRKITISFFFAQKMGKKHY